MTTAQKIVDEAIRTLLGSVGEEQNILAADIGAPGPILNFSFDLGGIRAGSVLALGTELVRVWSVDTTAKTANVQRAYGGTDATAHAAATIVDVNPRISRAAAFTALNEELQDLSSPSNGLFQMKTVEIQATADMSYDLGIDGYISGFEVRQQLPSLGQWQTLDNWRIIANSNTVEYPSGYALEISGAWQGRTMRIFYRAPFDQVTDLTDDVNDVAGLPQSCNDILTLGILSRLGPMREVQRQFTESQGNARKADEVPYTAITRSFGPVMQKRAERINAEAARLVRLYPQRKY